jgi:hypothetical protein
MLHSLYLFCYKVIISLVPGLGISRSPVDQAIADAQCQTMVLYGVPSDPDSASVIKEINRLRLSIQVIDPRKNNTYWEDLKNSGGKSEMPCLKIKRPNKRAKYLYNHEDINRFLGKEFS